MKNAVPQFLLMQKSEHSKIPFLVNNYRRRALLEYLSKNDGVADLDSAISHILTCEGKEVTNKTRKSVYVSLLQTHIPKLESENILKFVKSEGKIVLLHLPDDIKMYLETVERGDISWGMYYFFLSLIALGASVYLSNLFGILLSILLMISSATNIYSNKIKI
jgi:hypothetical protein